LDVVTPLAELSIHVTRERRLAFHVKHAPIPRPRIFTYGKGTECDVQTKPAARERRRNTFRRSSGTDIFDCSGADVRRD
jgi:hypothetical protein